jgi:uncharacterized membrane protein
VRGAGADWTLVDVNAFACPIARPHRLLLGILAGALTLRIALAGRSLWLDETLSYIQVDDLSLSAVIDRQVNGVHPPLFHVILHETIDVLGASPLTMRAPSIAWSLVAVVAVWAWSREAFPEASAVPAAALAAFAPFSVWYATEARMYAQVFALVAVSGWLSWRILGRGPSAASVAGLLVALAAALYSHYLTPTLVGGVMLLAGVLAVSRPALRRSALWVIAACGAAFVLFAPWVIWTMTHHAAEPVTTAYNEPDFFAVLISAQEMLVGFHPYASLGLAAAGWPALCLGAIALVPRLGSVGWRVGGLLLLVALPPLVLIVLALITSRSIFDSRYLIVAVPPLYLLVGRLLAGLRGRRGALCAALLIAAGIALSVQQNFAPDNPKLYELRSAVGVVNGHARPGDAVMFVPQINERGRRETITNYYGLTPGVRLVDTTPNGLSGSVSPGRAWTRLRSTRPRRLYVAYGDDTAVQGGGVTGVSEAYDRFFSERSRVVARLRFANVVVRVYAPNWGRPR